MKPLQPRPRPRLQAGFTLIEVLVAVGIVGVALLAGLQASSALTRNAQRQQDVILAQQCAQNELVRMRLINQMPAVGDFTVNCDQLNRQLQVRLTVSPTPNPSFRRVDAQVFSDNLPVLRVSTIVGRY
ncbi:type II secretion system minor pseudopilin GspI [Comamonas sp. lk]|uniref:type II secretion system minor pseudopilin GspI n=1 Tax=Comamonas sp. lk TaxID=2201272 RepID=UPI000EAEC85A|nr:type II secretion system minor pseudopilin GspI [Comamonas sp. lk]